ncbi:MAG TPA: hypothetical protein V6D28_05930 [Leptolyngbyaceae cyanobacterium]
MNNLLSIFVSAALISLLLPSKVKAVGFLESDVASDVGNIVGNAGITSTQPSGTILDSISGSLTAIPTGSNNPDIDLYQFIATGGNFSASTLGGTSIDTLLFLFDANGIGIVGSDNASVSSFQSIISGNLIPGQLYYIGVSSYGSNPQSSGGDIFNLPFTGQTTANGSGAGASLASWSPNGVPEYGSYTITLEGAQFIGNAEAVPFEFAPTFGLFILTLWVGWKLKKRKL